MVATVDHHHVLASMLACQAGKDVYCEKPLGLYVREGRALVQALASTDVSCRPARNSGRWR